ncbi:MAG: hypothetical protein ABIQ89_01145 [Candidatus Saccharimonadales bacterium]
MTEAQKDTIYIDVDDEITAIIDKVQTSDRKIVALVLPKRATVLQSIVNMKLLKKSAQKSKKNLVLITSEAGLMPLAGAVGLHVAKNLQSKPAIPEGPDTADIPESLVHEEELEGEDEPNIDKDASIGELAGVAAVAAAMPEAEETIDLDNADETVETSKKAAKKPKDKKDKKLKVPDFNKFRTWLIIGGVLLVLIMVAGFFGIRVLPKAKIVITTDSTDTEMTVDFTANTSTTTFDEAGKVVPAKLETSKKTDTQTAPATGEKNMGNKASGNVSMSVKQCSSISTPSAVPSGTGVSANGQTYITQSTVSFVFDSISGGCINFKSDGTTVIAQNPGTVYNIGSNAFTVAGRSDVTAKGSAAGGTDDIVKVVSQADVDAAKAKLPTAANADAAKKEMTASLEKSKLLVIGSSLTTDGPNVTTTPNVGDKADNVTVTATTTYTLLGVNQDDLKKIITAQANIQIDKTTQTVQDDGLGSASFTVDGKENPKVKVTTTVTIGPNLDTEAIKKEISGKKKAETIQIIESRPSIKEVTVSYSPFWVVKTPTNSKKVTITFEKAKN